MPTLTGLWDTSQISSTLQWMLYVAIYYTHYQCYSFEINNTSQRVELKISLKKFAQPGCPCITD